MDLNFNYSKFLFDNGIVGTTIGTLLGFSIKKIFDIFREKYLNPFLQIIIKIIFSTITIPDTELFSVIIEFLAILFVVYLISKFIIFPALYPQFVQKETDDVNRRQNLKQIVSHLKELKSRM